MLTRCSEALASVAPHLFEKIESNGVGAAIFAAHEVEGKIIGMSRGRERVRGGKARIIRLVARRGKRDKNIPCGETKQNGGTERRGDSKKIRY